MLEVDIKRFKKISAEILVVDYNGTLAFDGTMIPGVGEALKQLSQFLQIIILTADTFGKVKGEVKDFPVEVVILKESPEDEAKMNFVKKLNSSKVVAIGNGRNDALMLKEASLGIAVIQAEGAASQTLQNADLICTHILDAFALLEHPKRMIASLRK